MKEVTINICDYCKKEIKDNNWSGSSDEDFHDMRDGGEFSDGKRTCYEKHRKKLIDNAILEAFCNNGML